MKIPQLDNWPSNIKAAKAIQENLRKQVITVVDQLPEKIHHIAGVDMGFLEDGKTCGAAVAVLSFPDLQLVETSLAYLPTSFPYIPGYLSFREIPAIIDTLKNYKLSQI